MGDGRPFSSCAPALLISSLLILSFFPLLAYCSFNLYISSEEMQRTLGISARMDYVTGDTINEYSTRFPYRVAENVSHLRFTWNNAGDRNVRYSMRAVSEHFDVLPLLHLPAEGIVPRRSQDFVVEYRCVGARSGQFLVLLHFNVSLRPPLRFALKQEKICSSMEGRRSFSGGDDASHRPSLLDSDPSSPASLLPSLLFQLTIGSLLLSLLFCSSLFCCFYLFRSKRQKDDCRMAPGGPMREGRWRQGKFGSLYASGRMSLREKIRNCHGQKAKTTMGTTTTTTTISPSQHTIGIQPTRTPSSLALSSRSNSMTDELGHQQRVLHRPSFLLNGVPMPSSASEPQMPSTSTAPFPTSGFPSNFVAQPSLCSGRIWFERPEAQLLDINQALVELNADRNLFEQSPRAEMEGMYGQLLWANWRQIGASGQGAMVDEVDDEEDDAKEDKALICKTLKPGAGRTQFERFLRNALQFHYVPAHSKLAQVVAAATFGNFLNPDSVKDFPLICYAHNGFGVLKNFLHTCRSSGKQSLSQSMDFGHKQRSGQTDDGEAAEEAGAAQFSAGGPVRIVVTSTPSVALQEQQETTLRTHDLVSIGSQLISAICHLQKFGLVHKDIATRNCLVSRVSPRFGSDRLHVQLCDSALSRDLFSDDYALPLPLTADISSEEEAEELVEPRPVRWMAPELLVAASSAPPPLVAPAPAALSRHSPHASASFPLLHPAALSSVSPPLPFSSATDIWAFGVLLWELFTCAQQPYAELGPEEVVQAITDGGVRLSQPYNCPDELYEMMCHCWAIASEERPTAAELQVLLQEFVQRLRNYI
ncbi:WIF domain [Globodera pallida]|nr:WIF domain [Globodera pallida]